MMADSSARDESQQGRDEGQQGRADAEREQRGSEDIGHDITQYWERLRRESRQRNELAAERERREEEEEEQEREEEEEEEEERRLQHSERTRNALAVAATVGFCLAQQGAAAVRSRAPAVERPRLDWDKHATRSAREKTFRRKYRMDERSFNKLVEILRPDLERDANFASLRSKSGVISVETRVALAVRLCAGASYLDLLDVHGVSPTALYSCLRVVVNAILEKKAEVGPMAFPTTPEQLEELATEFQAKSTGEMFSGCVGAADGLHIRTTAPSIHDILNVIRYYSGSKGCYGLNVQAIADARYRFVCMSCISPGSTNDWTAFNSSKMSDAVAALPRGYYILGDAAYPLSDQLLTPYPGKGLCQEKDSFNFHLSQLRVKVEQSFGVLVARWGILWRPLRVSFDERPRLIRALFHLHNFCIDEGSTPIRCSEENSSRRRHRPQTKNGILPEEYRTPKANRPKRSGEVGMRRGIMLSLQRVGQKRPRRNVIRNTPR